MRLMSWLLAGSLIATGLAVEAQAQGGRLRERLLARMAKGAEAPVPAGVDQRTLQIGGTTRTYLVLDARRDRSKPAPLVVALHGGGGSGKTMVPRWAAKAQAEGLVVAFPDGIGRDPRIATWNAGGCCGEAMNRRSDDVGFISALIDSLVQSGAADPRRAYVTGMSNGGMMSYKIAIALPGKVAAVAVVSGAMFGDEAPPAAPMPILVMHGVKDQIVPYAGGPSPVRFVANAQALPFQPVEKSVDFWVKANGCTTAPVASPAGEVQTKDWTGCKGGSEVLFYRLASATHSWPGAVVPEGATRMLEMAPYDAVNATNVAWDFFKRHARP